MGYLANPKVGSGGLRLIFGIRWFIQIKSSCGIGISPRNKMINWQPRQTTPRQRTRFPQTHNNKKILWQFHNVLIPSRNFFSHALSIHCWREINALAREFIPLGSLDSRYLLRPPVIYGVPEKPRWPPMSSSVQKVNRIENKKNKRTGQEKNGFFQKRIAKVWGGQEGKVVISHSGGKDAPLSLGARRGY